MCHQQLLSRKATAPRVMKTPEVTPLAPATPHHQPASSSPKLPLHPKLSQCRLQHRLCCGLLQSKNSTKKDSLHQASWSPTHQHHENSRPHTEGRISGRTRTSPTGPSRSGRNFSLELYQRGRLQCIHAGLWQKREAQLRLVQHFHY